MKHLTHVFLASLVLPLAYVSTAKAEETEKTCNVECMILGSKDIWYPKKTIKVPGVIGPRSSMKFDAKICKPKKGFDTFAACQEAMPGVCKDKSSCRVRPKLGG